MRPRAMSEPMATPKPGGEQAPEASLQAPVAVDKVTKKNRKKYEKKKQKQRTTAPNAESDHASEPNSPSVEPSSAWPDNYTIKLMADGLSHGAFAARHISRGDFILAEAPMIIAICEDTSATGLHEPSSSVANFFDAYSDRDQPHASPEEFKQFAQLHCLPDFDDDYFSVWRSVKDTGEASQTHRDKLPPQLIDNTKTMGFLQGSKTPVSEELFESRVTYLSTFKTNMFRLQRPPGDEWAVSPQLARFNHSCVPNASRAWNSETGVQTLYALRNIKEGEEICMSYLPEGWFAKEDRAEYLRYHYCIVCKCPICRDTDYAKTFDARRRKYKPILTNLCELFHAKQPAEEEKELLKKISHGGHKLMRMLDKDRQPDEQYAYMLAYLAVFAMWRGKYCKAMALLHRQLELYITLRGYGNPAVLTLLINLNLLQEKMDSKTPFKPGPPHDAAIHRITKMTLNMIERMHPTRDSARSSDDASDPNGENKYGVATGEADIEQKVSHHDSHNVLNGGGVAFGGAETQAEETYGW